VENRTTPILGAYSLLNKIKPLNQPLKINLTLLKVIYGGDKYIIVFQLPKLSTFGGVPYFSVSPFGLF